MNDRRICYNCFQSYYPEELLGICPECPAERDPQLELYYKFALAVPPRFPLGGTEGSGGEAGELKCSRGHLTPLRACPHCHAQVQLSWSDPGRVLALVGPGASGKSTYIGALLEQLSRYPQLCFHSYGLTMDPASEGAFNQVRDYMFGANTFPLATQNAMAGTDLPTPIVSQLILPAPMGIMRLPRFFRTRFKPDVMVPLVFYDYPGEGFVNHDTPLVRYAAMAEGLMLAVDATVLPHVELREGCPKPSPGKIRAEGLDPLELVRTMTDAVRARVDRAGMRGVKIDKPVAVMLLKADEVPALKPTLQAMLDRRKEEGERRRYPARLVDANHDAGARFLRDWGAGGLLEVLELNFTSVKVFPVVAAWRDAPSEKRIRANWNAVGIEEPLYWLLTQLGYFRI
ncbi:MAG: hypothetical protein ABIO70_28860 [Pseudomonadota bacterium]